MTPDDADNPVEPTDSERYELTLFVNGASERSARAIADVRGLCDNYLAGRFNLDIIDVHENPALVTRLRVLAAPTLVKERPLPACMLVGELSDQGRVFEALTSSARNGARERR